ncbi:MAG: ATP-binding cassette domain-containing protein [Acidobacteriota bacterium]
MTLTVSKISKRYGDKWALRDVGFDVVDGEIFGIFGDIGSGKSTLLRCIAGDEKISGGSISLDGAEWSKQTKRGRDVQMAGVSDPTGIVSLLARRNTVASSGETRLSELREALQTDKKVLLLDDPLIAIKSREREAVVLDIRRFAEHGNIVLMASSTFEDIATNCDRMAIIVDGEIIQIDTPQNIYEHPTTVSSVIGRSNLIAARRLSSTTADLPEFMSLSGGHRLFAQATEKNRLGAINQNVVLAIRPEQVSISFGASFPEDNLLKAVVTGIRFHGETTLVELDASGLLLEARVFRVVGLAAGDECMVSLPPDRLQVLKN